MNSRNGTQGRVTFSERSSFIAFSSSAFVVPDRHGKTEDVGALSRADRSPSLRLRDRPCRRPRPPRTSEPRVSEAIPNPFREQLAPHPPQRPSSRQALSFYRTFPPFHGGGRAAENPTAPPSALRGPAAGGKIPSGPELGSTFRIDAFLVPRQSQRQR